MGRQTNKTEKRKRRVAYLKRKKETTKATKPKATKPKATKPKAEAKKG